MGTVDRVDPIRIMIVDDSRTVRRLVHRLLSGVPGVDVVAECTNGREAVEMVAETGADVVLLDLEMPEMDGLTALPLLIERAPEVAVVMVSQRTKPRAEATLKALAMGAAETILKPDALGGDGALGSFKGDLAATVRALGDGVRRRRGERAPAPLAGVEPPGPSVQAHQRIVALRPPSAAPVQVLGIGCSTGGPKALQELLHHLALPLSVPILIAQHMPSSFTAILADQLERTLRVPCREAAEGERLRPGRVYLAPGDRHMIVRAQDTGPGVALTTDPPENYCRPAVDPLFRSLAQVFGPGALGLVLTGMGTDGLKGARAIADAGGTLMAQDEATSVVWGMPGAVATAGLCSAVEPVPALAQRALELVRRVPS